MNIDRTAAGILAHNMARCAHEYDFNWRLFARLCITAGMKNKFRQVADSIGRQYSFPFADADTPVSALVMGRLY